MEDFPDEVIESILKFVNVASQPVCRSICSRWKAEIERLGLAVVIDDREKNLLDFIRNTVIKEAHVKYLSCQDAEWLTLCLDDVRTLIFSGYVHQKFIKVNLLKATHWRNLKKLLFYGTSLISQPFAESGIVLKPIHCILSNLKELHIILPSGTTTQAVEQFSHGIEKNQFSIPLGSPLRSNPELYLRTVLDKRANMNARFLLNSINAPNLKTLFFCLGRHYSTFNYNQLFRFVAKHGNSLDELICPSINMVDDITIEFREGADRLRLMKTKLKSVFFSEVSCLLRMDDIWTNFVLAQTHLEDVFIQFYQFPTDTFIPFVNTIFSNNFKTLRYVTIKSEGLEEYEEGCLELDMQLLASCTLLEVLRICQRRQGRKPVFYPVAKCACCTNCGCEEGLITVSSDSNLISRLKNINSLPVTLKVFETTFSTNEDFDGVRFLKEMVNLEEVKMTGIRRIGFMEQRPHVLQFIKLAMRHRLLNSFEIEFQFLKSVVPDIGRSWDELRRFDDFEEPYISLFQILHPAAVMEAHTSWLVESLYFGGMFAENLFADLRDTGYTIKNHRNVSYMRNYFDAIDKGLIPCRIETFPPYDVDRSGNSYTINGGLMDEACWGGTRSPLRSITSSSAHFHKVYNRCNVDQGGCRVVLLVNEVVRLEQMFKWMMSNIDPGKFKRTKKGRKKKGKIIASDAELDESDFESEGTAENSSISTSTLATLTELDIEDTGNTTPIVFNNSTCFILPGDKKPVII